MIALSMPPSDDTVQVGTIYFIGVSTGQSTISRLFPRWAELLGLGGPRGAAVLVGVDLPLQAPEEQYRELVACMRTDSRACGAVVTGHKLGVYAAAGDMFDELDPNALLCREVGQVRKRGGRLVGEATDPDDAGAALESIVGRDYWGQEGGHLLLLGAGGAGTALLVHLLMRPRDRPLRVLVVDEAAERLQRLGEIVDRIGAGVAVDYYRHTSPEDNDSLLSRLPPRSVVVNATGRGKDLPGSPISDRGVFPWQGVVWELNYRGERQFLRQAGAQARARRLRVEDGWNYFVTSWIRHLAAIFDHKISTAEMVELQAAAEELHAHEGSHRTRFP
jgi:shikimate 5-dehydrogenase